MTALPANTSRCPHCGKTAAGGYKLPAHLLISVLLLGLALFFWVTGRNRLADAVNQARLTSDQKAGGVIAYIWSPEADKACGGCLASAGKFVEEKKTAALREKTKDMAYLSAGEYQIGSPEGAGDPDEHPRHKVYLDAFYIDKYEASTADYMKFAAAANANYPEWAKPGGQFNIDTGSKSYYRHLSSVFKNCGGCPIVGVTAKDARAYCAAKNKRLPTEAEWEAAARGGTDSIFSFGDDPAATAEYAWYEADSGGEPHLAGRKKPNGAGIYDMHGNVWEWTADLYDKEYYRESPRLNPAGPVSGSDNVIRGGSWAFDADSLRSANRAGSDKSNDDIGLRCAVSEAALSETAAAPGAVDIVR
ncbi:MAG: SUMF1/EgtB/PvdO family nonheme iron enzyme [Elusimicrobiales bacterium]